MKTISTYCIVALAAIICGLLASCSDFEPTGYPEVPALQTAANLNADVKGKSVTLTWRLPERGDIEGVMIYSRSKGTASMRIDGTPESAVLKGQQMGQDYLYTVKVLYKGGYMSEGVSVKAAIPVVEAKIGYLMTAPSIAELPDDDERAAASWFKTQNNAELVFADDLKNLNADEYGVLWIEIDRMGLPMGWKNLPPQIVSDEAIAALRRFSADGGSIYLSNMATQLTVPLGMVPDNMAPTVYGNGEGGRGDDVWVINPYLGWDFRNGSDQGFYDRTAHAIFKGLTLEDPNKYGYMNLPLIGPGQREDHNCLWDCNIYGRGSQPDVIKNFEVATNSLVLATWGHVRDHCVAGLVEFYSTPSHGRCIANGLAAYEWNQNSGANPYQHNIEQLTANILNYLK